MYKTCATCTMVHVQTLPGSSIVLQGKLVLKKPFVGKIATPVVQVTVACAVYCLSRCLAVTNGAFLAQVQTVVTRSSLQNFNCDWSKAGCLRRKHGNLAAPCYHS
jgi:hypothetical protein